MRASLGDPSQFGQQKRASPAGAVPAMRTQGMLFPLMGAGSVSRCSTGTGKGLPSMKASAHHIRESWVSASGCESAGGPESACVLGSSGPMGAPQPVRASAEMTRVAARAMSLLLSMMRV